jgi:hypothetical protein
VRLSVELYGQFHPTSKKTKLVSCTKMYVWLWNKYGVQNPSHSRSCDKRIFQVHTQTRCTFASKSQIIGYFEWTDRRTDCDKFTCLPSFTYHEIIATIDCWWNWWLKISQLKASRKDSKMLHESWTCKTAKIISRTRHVRPWSVDVLTKASKVLRETFYYVSYSVSD